METNAPDTQSPAARDDRHGRAAGISLGIAGFAMVMLFVLPGFLAAGFTHVTPTYFSEGGEVNWDAEWSKLQTHAYVRAELVMLAPSGWVMKRSPLIRRFYNWQYHTARGMDFGITGGIIEYDFSHR